MMNHQGKLKRTLFSKRKWIRPMSTRNQVEIYFDKKDKQKAIDNFQQAAKLFKAQGDTKNHQLMIDALKEIQK